MGKTDESGGDVPPRRVRVASEDDVVDVFLAGQHALRLTREEAALLHAFLGTRLGMTPVVELD